MWANVQCDGRPAEHRWRPLFNGAKFGWCPLLDCCAVTLTICESRWNPLSNVSAVMKPRCETHWNLLGCPKLTNGRQPLVGWGSPYCDDMWTIYCCLTSFFPIVDKCLSWEPDKVLQWCADGDFLHSFWHPVFLASSVQHISDIHSKFALRPHHMRTLCRPIQSPITAH